MKRFLFAVVLGAGLALGARAETDARAMAVIKDIQQGVDNMNRIERLKVGTAVDLPAGSLETADLAAGAVTAAKLASVGTVVAPTSYASRVLVQLGSIPTNAADSKTVTFATPFSATPAVTVCAEAATTNIWYITAINRTNFTVRSEAAVAGGYVAAGLTP